jgi:hypothetical protein
MSDIAPQSPLDSLPELLAGYVLGDLSPSEIVLVEEYLAAHPEQQAEVDSLMLPLDLLSLTLPANNPPASLRAQILHLATAETQLTTSKPARVVEVESQPSWQFWGQQVKSRVVAGLGLLLVAGLGWNSYRLSQELALVKQDLRKSQIDGDRSIASLLPEPNNRYFSLKNMPGKTGMGSLVMVPNKSVALLALQKVEPLPPGQVYRVWAIMGDKEMNCAHFLPDADGKVLMQIPVKSWETTKKITITIEQKEATLPVGKIAIEGEI